VDGYDATYNDPEVATLVEAVATEIVGEDHIHPPEPTMGGEDFGYMTRLAPGVMFNLGAKYDDKDRPHHTPVFNIDESAFPIGAAVLAETAIRLLNGKI
jgi:amidohydrolase